MKHLLIFEKNYFIIILKNNKNVCNNSEKTGYDLSSEKEYFNSDVMYVKDTLKVRAFYNKLHQNWLKGIETIQQSLTQTNIKELYGIYNFK